MSPSHHLPYTVQAFTPMQPALVRVGPCLPSNWISAPHPDILTLTIPGRTVQEELPMRWHIPAATIFAAALCALSPITLAAEVTFESLVREMTDLDALGRSRPATNAPQFRATTAARRSRVLNEETGSRTVTRPALRKKPATAPRMVDGRRRRPGASPIVRPTHERRHRPRLLETPRPSSKLRSRTCSRQHGPSLPHFAIRSRGWTLVSIYANTAKSRPATGFVITGDSDL